MASNTPSRSPPVSPPSRATTAPTRTSPPHSPAGRSRTSSTTSHRNQSYAPAHPSGLRHATTPALSPTPSPNVDVRSSFLGSGDLYTIASQNDAERQQDRGRGREDEDQDIPSEHSRLLTASPDVMEHATFPSRMRPRMSRHYDSFSPHMQEHDSDHNSTYNGDGDSIRSWGQGMSITEAVENVMAVAETESVATAKRLAKRYGIRNQKRM